MRTSSETRFRFPRGNGFTLIELLVVIAIVGVLAALLVPAVSKGITKAKETKKMANYRQYSMANNLYAADHDGYTCPAYDQTVPSSPSFLQILLTYFNLTSLKDAFYREPFVKNYDVNKPWLTGTGMNVRVMLPASNTQNIGSLGYFKLINITYPEIRVLIGDCPITTYTIDPVKPATIDTTRHDSGKKGMFLLFDGRVVLYTEGEAELAMKDPGALKAQTGQ